MKFDLLNKKVNELTVPEPDIIMTSDNLGMPVMESVPRIVKRHV
jgi:hypothetical protein